MVCAVWRKKFGNLFSVISDYVLQKLFRVYLKLQGNCESVEDVVEGRQSIGTCTQTACAPTQRRYVDGVAT